MRTHHRLLIFFGFATLAAACGLGGADSLFGDSEGTGAGSMGGASGSSTSTSTSSSGASSSSGSSTTSSTSSSGTMTTSSGMSSSSTTTSSSGGTGPSSSSSSTSSGTTVVPCAGSPCQPGEICCFDTSQPNDHCGQAGTCGQGFIELSCNDPSDCPGQFCCGDLVQGQQVPYTGVYCQATCQGQGKIQLCDANNPQCPPGTTCQQSQILGQGYMICRP